MRLEELLSLKWEQVDLERREVRLVLTKSKRPRMVPLSDKAVAVLVAGTRDHRASTYVFINSATGERYRTIQRAFRTVCRRAGLEDLRFHDLRHTFASWAVQSGVDLYPLSRILGHSSLQMTTRYAHLIDAAPSRGHQDDGYINGYRGVRLAVSPGQVHCYPGRPEVNRPWWGVRTSNRICHSNEPPGLGVKSLKRRE